MKLYELADEYQEALEALDGEDEQLIADTLESLQGGIEEKLGNAGAYVQNLIAEHDAIKLAADRMAARQKALKSKIDKIRRYMAINAILCDIKKIDLPEFSMGFNEGRESVVVDDDSKLNRFKIPQPPKLDKQTISKKLKAGEEIEGAHLQKGDPYVVFK